MTDDADARAGDGTPTFETGRYLYCAVRAADGPDDFSTTGIDDDPAYLIDCDGVGVVVQEVEGIFDSDRIDQVRRWLLSHQGVVDEAGEAFGTPLPFRFDTILTGDDDLVREWVADNRATIGDALESLAGRWEYRIEVLWDESRVEELVVTDDDRLQELRERREEASEGTGFMLEKQYERELRKRLEARKRDVADDLHARLEPHVEAIERAGDGGALGASASDDDESVVQYAILAPRESEEVVGEELESIDAREEYEVRYTGPWPPYTFAPSIGNGEDGS